MMNKNLVEKKVLAGIENGTVVCTRNEDNMANGRDYEGVIFHNGKKRSIKLITAYTRTLEIYVDGERLYFSQSCGEGRKVY